MAPLISMAPLTPKQPLVGPPLLHRRLQIIHQHHLHPKRDPNSDPKREPKKDPSKNPPKDPKTDPKTDPKWPH